MVFLRRYRDIDVLTAGEGLLEEQVRPLGSDSDVEDRVAQGLRDTCCCPLVLCLGDELLAVVRTQSEQNSPEE